MDDPTPEEFSVGGFALTRVPPERIVARRELTAAISTRGGQITGNGDLRRCALRIPINRTYRHGFHCGADVVARQLRLMRGEVDEQYRGYGL